METLRQEVAKLRRQVALALGNEKTYWVLGTVIATVLIRKWLRERNRDRAINRFLRDVMAREGNLASASGTVGEGGGSPLHVSKSISNFKSSTSYQQRLRPSKSLASFQTTAGATGIRRNKSLHRLQKLLQTAGGPPICEDCFSRTSR